MSHSNPRGTPDFTGRNSRIDDTIDDGSGLIAGNWCEFECSRSIYKSHFILGSPHQGHQKCYVWNVGKKVAGLGLEPGTSGTGRKAANRAAIAPHYLMHLLFGDALVDCVYRDCPMQALVTRDMRKSAGYVLIQWILDSTDSFRLTDDSSYK